MGPATVPGMGEPGIAVELIWWDDETSRYRWTYRRGDVHRTGEAWTWEIADHALACARTQRSAPQLPVQLPPGGVDRLRYWLGRGPET